MRALERNDFEALPDEDAMVATLQAYAECLKVDAEMMIEDYRRERENVLRRLAETVTEQAPEISPAVMPSVMKPIKKSAIPTPTRRMTRYNQARLPASIA